MALDKLRKELKKECPPDHWVWKMEVTLKRLKKKQEVHERPVGQFVVCTPPTVSGHQAAQR